MDIKALLPLLLAGNKNTEQIAPVLNMLSNGDGSEKNTSDTLISSLISSSGSKIPPEILAQAMSGNQKKTPSGISPILGVVNDDILGKMIKFLSQN